MAAYLDTSVVLRVVLGQPESMDLSRHRPAFTSILTRVECLRSLDRTRILAGLSSEDLALRREAVFTALAGVEIVDLDDAILERASLPAPVPIRTLDSLHLATSLQWRDLHGGKVVFATHDRGLGTAARAYGLKVVGI